VKRHEWNVWVLACCQAIKLSQTSLMFAVVALIAQRISGSATLATLPIALSLLTTMASTIPSRLIMARYGSRRGFLFAAAIGVLGAALGVASVAIGSFALLCVGMAIQGWFIGASNFYRFVAADQSPPQSKEKAISYVMAGGVLAAFFGPNLANITKNLLKAPEFFGGFLSIFVLSVITVVMLSFLRLPALTHEVHEEKGRSMSAIARQPEFIVSVIGGVFGYATMTFLMLATPLAMRSHHHPFHATASVIQWHVFAMFAPAFYTGQLIRRFGAPSVMVVGALLELTCAAINLSGHEYVHYSTALFTLGVGWNFLFIGATALATRTYRVQERAKAQAANDFIVSSGVALGSFLTGVVQAKWGWRTANLAVMPGLILTLASLAWLRTDAARTRASIAGKGVLEPLRKG
jgi:predicted MFS family arabinose efflux permease